MGVWLEEGTILVRWMQVASPLAAEMDRWRTVLDPGERARADRFRFTVVSPKTVENFLHRAYENLASRAERSSPTQWKPEGHGPCTSTEPRLYLQRAGRIHGHGFRP